MIILLILSLPHPLYTPPFRVRACIRDRNLGAIRPWAGSSLITANGISGAIGRPPILWVPIPKRTECRAAAYRSAAIVATPSIHRKPGAGTRSATAPMRAAPERGGDGDRCEGAGMAERTEHRRRRYLSVRELVDRYEGRVSTRTLRRWRAVGAGPSWFRLGGRILYPLDDLERWEQARPRRPIPSEAKSDAGVTLRCVGTSRTFS